MDICSFLGIARFAGHEHAPVASISFTRQRQISARAHVSRFRQPSLFAAAADDHVAEEARI